MEVVLELAGLLLGSCAVAVGVIALAAYLLRQFPLRSDGAWRRRYTIAAAAGATLGAGLGVVITFVAMAVSGGLPAPLNVLVFPLGSLAGGLALGLVFTLPVALVHAGCALARRAKSVGPGPRL